MALPFNITDWCLNCDDIEIPTDDVFKGLVIQALCSIIAGGGGGGGSGTTAIEACRVVTTAGAWGAIGDLITEVRFFSGDPPALTSTVYFNETAGGTVVTGITAGNSAPCPGESQGADCDSPLFVMECNQTTGEVVLTSTAVTAPATIAAGFWSVSIDNVGAAAGVVNGISLPAGRSFSATGYVAYPPGSSPKQMAYLPEILIDGTGTTLNVVTLA